MKILYYTGWTLFRVISKLFFRIKIRGREHFPLTGGFIVATNHISNYDPPLVGSWSPRQLYFLAKRELFRNPVFGFLIRRTNALPVSRGGIDREAIRLSVKAIEDGFGLVVFPEGTRSRTSDFLPAKAGLGMIAHRAGCAIVPGYIRGSNTLRACLLGRQRMCIVFGSAIPAKWVKAQPTGKAGYQLISNAAMERIGALRDEAERTDGAAPRASEG